MHRAGILHKRRGCAATPELFQSLTQANKDGVRGVEKSGGIEQLASVGIRPYNQGGGWTQMRVVNRELSMIFINSTAQPKR